MAKNQLQAAKKSLRVGIRNSSVSCIIGCGPIERQTEQTLSIDIGFTLKRTHMPQEDRIDHTVDYVELFHHVEKMLKERQFNLLETAAVTIAESLVREYRMIASCHLCLSKANPYPGIQVSFAECTAYSDDNTEGDDT